MSDDNLVNVGPLTLRLTPEAVEMITNEWSRRAYDFTEQHERVMSIEDVLSAMLNEVAAPEDEEEEESEEERVERIIALLHEAEEEPES